MEGEYVEVLNSHSRIRILTDTTLILKSDHLLYFASYDICYRMPAIKVDKAMLNMYLFIRQ